MSKTKISEKGDELFACSRCGACLAVCPVYKQTLDEGVAPRGKLSLIEAAANNKIPISEKLSQKIYTCTLCNYCTKECPSGVKVDELFKAVRGDLVESKKYPEVLDYLKSKIEKAYNITFDTNQGRLDWITQQPDVKAEDYLKETADVLYFVGCVSSFSPRSFPIPRSITQIFKRAGVDFTLLGEDEWCCGFPLYSSGMKDEIVRLADHNIRKVKDKKAKLLVASCPSCYHTWKHDYPKVANEKIDFEIMHISEYLHTLIKEGKIKLNAINAKVTYHDPCDLGRNSGIFDPPREVLKAIPGIRLVELPNNRQLSTCCGGGGNLEMVDPELSGKVAQMKVEEVLKTGADMVVSSCQQCLRTIFTRARRQKIDLVVKDLTEIVAEAMGGKP